MNLIQIDSMKDKKKKNPKYPYCAVCESCGEDGRCSALICQHSKDGEYCEWYMRELKFAYKMYHDIYPFLKDDEESKKKIDEIWDKNHDSIFND